VSETTALVLLGIASSIAIAAIVIVAMMLDHRR
jgi:hypothetical protein